MVCAGGDADAAALHLGLQAMLDAVFYQGLQQQGRHRLVAQCIGQVQGELQPRPHADGHELQVVVQAGKLIGQGVAGAACRRARGRERGPQVGNHVVQHGLGPGRVEADQRPQVGQGVEQHVRLQLRFEQLELGLAGLAAGNLEVLPLSGELLPAHKYPANRAAGHQAHKQHAPGHAGGLFPVLKRGGAQDQVGQQMAAHIAQHHRHRHDEDQPGHLLLPVVHQEEVRTLDVAPDANADAVRIQQVEAERVVVKQRDAQRNNGVEDQHLEAAQG